MQLNENKCELLGIYLGDGCLSKNKRYSEIAISGDIIEERDYYENYVIPLFNKEFCSESYKVNGKAYPKVGVYGFWCFRREIAEAFANAFDLKFGPKNNVEIPAVVLNNDVYLRRVIRGLFDTDGCISFGKNYTMKNSLHKVPKIELSLISEKLIKQVYDGLLTLGFSPFLSGPIKRRPNEKPLFKIKIKHKADIERWLKDIGFRSSKHLTKIEIWRKFGYCPPNTTFAARQQILSSGKI